VAAVVDLYSRRVVGWSMSSSMAAQLVTDALIMAIRRRGKPDSLLHHSDQGSQGGFNRSSQHPLKGGCNEGVQACFRSVYAQQAALAWTAARTSEYDKNVTGSTPSEKKGHLAPRASSGKLRREHPTLDRPYVVPNA
jgi:hypothetical protein